ncbi:hypothetical protein GGS23DRAFT_570738, partial [Durotheca rogersii]|uniref:uncharacterized protein n=1 Tax=Durotheca rogersii TaxID=419775 RepID=UPI00221FB42D
MDKETPSALLDKLILYVPNLYAYCNGMGHYLLHSYYLLRILTHVHVYMYINIYAGYVYTYIGISKVCTRKVCTACSL